MRHGALFNGIGGFQLAAHWMGWENVFHCEIDPFCNKVVKRHFPESICYEDIKKTDFSEWRGAIDILTGGEPCQPHSLAGSRKGKEDSRYLWPEYYRCAHECRPGRIVNENVAGSISNGTLDQKILDLETIGYACWPPLVIPAGALGALHRRDRIWLVAYSNEWRLQKRVPSALLPKEGEGEESVDPGLFVAKWREGQNKPHILRMAHGISGGLDARRRIKAGGNAIVPEVAYHIFRAIEQYEQL